MENRSRFRLALVLVTILALVACEPERVVIQSGARGYAGYHIGYSWAGEATGTALKDSSAYIQTILRLDEDANILEAKMLYWQQFGGYWTTRQSANAQINVNFNTNPTPGTLGAGYRPGTSMFSVYTVGQMSMWIAAVNADGVVAVGIVEPLTRYRFEMKFPAGFDHRTQLRELTVGSGLSVPTVRTAGGAFLAPTSWDELADKHIFDFHRYSHVLNDVGVFAGITGNSTVRNFLEAMGVEFEGTVPKPMPVRYGYFGIGGWPGNYAAIERYLIGRNARDLTSLVDWSIDRYRAGINAQNQFGVDAGSGATTTAQNSVDGIAGATVRMSRESTSYQRALVHAGIISEADVIIGRF